MLTIATVALVLNVEQEAEAFDAINEILREQQRAYAPRSCLIDYATRITEKREDLSAEDYVEGEAFADETPISVGDAIAGAEGAISALLHQVSQMCGMFDDEDGTIAAAVEAGEDALENLRRAKPSISVAAREKAISVCCALIERFGGALADEHAPIDGYDAVDFLTEVYPAARDALANSGAE